MALNSGQSELRFRGRSSDQLDATISLDVASLNDWVPDSGGELQAEFVVRGKWPDLSINGDARGRDLHAANVRVESLNARADVDDPRNPEGSIRLDLTKLTAAGFQFDTVRAEASGTPKSHRLALRVNGQPLALELDLQGAQTDDGWAGSLQNLVVNVKEAARLALREPANIVLGKDTAEVSKHVSSTVVWSYRRRRITTRWCNSRELFARQSAAGSRQCARDGRVADQARRNAARPRRAQAYTAGRAVRRRADRIGRRQRLSTRGGGAGRRDAGAAAEAARLSKLQDRRDSVRAGRTRDVRYAAGAECDVARRGQRS